MNCLVHFCVAAQHQSFTKAAQELHLTHGAISRSIKQLEDYMGFELFERRNRRIYLNALGETFFQRTTLALNDIQSACEDLKQQKSQDKISISCEPSLAMRWLMPRLHEPQTLLEGVDIQLSTAGGPIDLLGNNMDMAIRRSDFNWPSDYWVTELGNEWIGPVCNPSYLKNVQHGMAHCLHSRTRPSAWQDWAGCAEEELDFIGEKFFDHFYFSLQAATAGLGVAMGPAQLVYDDLQQGNLLAPKGFVETDFRYVVLTKSKPMPETALHTFIMWLQKAFIEAQP